MKKIITEFKDAISAFLTSLGESPKRHYVSEGDLEMLRMVDCKLSEISGDMQRGKPIDAEQIHQLSYQLKVAVRSITA